MPLYAITAVGQDRPGIVAEFTGVLYRQGCNLEDSTMTRLRDQFAMMLIVEAPADAYLALESALRLIASQLGLSLVIRPVAAALPEEPPGEEAYLLRVYGADRPGIVHAVTSLLARHGLNITDLNTRVIPGGRGPVYVMLLEVQAPGPEAVVSMGPELERLREQLGVEISCEPLDQEAL